MSNKLLDCLFALLLTSSMVLTLSPIRHLKRWFDRFFVNLLLIMWIFKISIQIWMKRPKTQQWLNKLASITDLFAYFTHLEFLFDSLIVPCLIVIKMTSGLEVLYGNKVDYIIVAFNHAYGFILCGWFLDGVIYRMISDILSDTLLFEAFAMYCELNPQKLCPICWDVLNEDLEIILLGCGHVFHQQCIAKYDGDRCCYCRHPLFSWNKWQLRDAILKSTVSWSQLVWAQMESRWQEYCRSLHWGSIHWQTNLRPGWW
eukprot:149103_1